MTRRLRKHRITVVITVEEPVTRGEALAYIQEAVKTWAGQRFARYATENEGYEDEDRILLGEVKQVDVA